MRAATIGLLAALGSVAGYAGGASAQTFADGGAAYQKGDYATALKDWLPLANAGSASAQVNLGMMYHSGQGVTADETKAAAWFQKAADLGNADGERMLGLDYDSGAGVPKNPALAAAWLLKAAKQGDADSQGMMGTLYYQGVGVPKDLVQAYMWMTISAPALAKLNATLGQDVANSLSAAASQMTPAQIAQGKALAAAWKPVANAAPAILNVAGVWDVNGAIATGGPADLVVKGQCTLHQAAQRISGDCVGADSKGPVSGALDGQHLAWQADLSPTRPDGGAGALRFDGQIGADGVVRGQVTYAGLPGRSGAFTAERLAK